MGARYGILLVTGNHTHQENYAQAFAADKRCRLIAVTDEPNVDRRRRDLNERLAKALDVPHVADLSTALARKDVHVVSVCAPPERRARGIVQCAPARQHLFLGKTLCPPPPVAGGKVSAVPHARGQRHMFSFLSPPPAPQAHRL